MTKEQVLLNIKEYFLTLSAYENTDQFMESTDQDEYTLNLVSLNTNICNSTKKRQHYFDILCRSDLRSASSSTSAENT